MYQDNFQQTPPKKRFPLWAIGLGAFLVSLCICSSSVIYSTHSSNQIQQDVQQIQVSPTSVETKKLNWHTIQAFSGSGSRKTETFSVPNDWKILWSCNPSSSDLGQYNMMISVYNSDTTAYDLFAINDMCKSGTTSGMTEERSAGNVYLDIQSEGSWSVTIQVLS